MRISRGIPENPEKETKNLKNKEDRKEWRRLYHKTTHNAGNASGVLLFLTDSFGTLDLNHFQDL
jgi:hypothetical protein